MTQATLTPTTAHAPNDPDTFFRTDHLHADLKGRSVRGGIVTLLAQGLNFGLHTGSTMILARLLTPMDFGLIFMVTAVTNFVALFKDAGLSMATVQKAEITHAQVSTLFWINVGLSALLTVVLVLLAPAVAWFYAEPRLVLITIALAAPLVFGGLTVQHQALLRRQMRFKELAAIEVLSLAAGLAGAISLALYFRNYWALVAQPALMGLTNMMLVWSLCHWRPGWPRRGSGVWPLLAFGGNLTGFSFVNFFSRNADNVLIGWMWGGSALGLYGKAYSLLMLPIKQINSPATAVVLPTLSRLQNDPARFRRYYCAMLGALASLGMPLCVFALVAANPLVNLFLGPQWDASVPIFRALAPAALAWTLNVANGWLLVALGRTDRHFRYGLVLSIAIVGAFAAGLSWGPIGVAVSYSVVVVVSRPLSWWYCFRGTPVTVSDLLRSVARPAAAALLAALPAALVLALWYGPDWAIVQIILAGSAYGACYGAVWRLLPGGRVASERLYDLVKHLRTGTGPSSAVAARD